jgi:hypothetical protein
MQWRHVWGVDVYLQLFLISAYNWDETATDSTDKYLSLSWPRSERNTVSGYDTFPHPYHLAHKLVTPTHPAAASPLNTQVNYFLFFI